MKAIEDIVAEKLIGMVDFALSKIIKPDITIDKVRELGEKQIDKLKAEYGIEGIILDVDDTLRTDMKNIPECNKQWVESLKGKLKVTILSNGIDKNVEKYFNINGIGYISFAHKPLKKNFIKACKKMKLSPEKVMVIGDGLITDIYGGKKNKMKTVLVKNVEDEER